MKKLLILCLLFPLHAFAANEYFVDGSGNATVRPSSGVANITAGYFPYVTSGVNYFGFLSDVTGTGPHLQAKGTDTDISVNIEPKNAGHVNFISGGGVQVAIASITSPVNYLMMNGGVSGDPPVIYSNSFNGQDTDVGLKFGTRGVAGFTYVTSLNNGNAATEVFISHHAGGNANYIGLQGSSAGSPSVIYVDGSDANIDLKVQPKGTGLVKFGSYTAGACTVGGYIQIKDSGGTTRKLAVCN